MKERAELPSDEGDVVKEFKAMHEEDFWSSWPREERKVKKKEWQKLNIARTKQFLERSYSVKVRIEELQGVLGPERTTRCGTQSTVQSMSVILGRRHRLLHVRSLLAKRNGGEQEICPVHHGSPLDSQLLHQERATPRAPLREETRGSRVLHRELAQEEMQEEKFLGHSRPVHPR